MVLWITSCAESPNLPSLEPARVPSPAASVTSYHVRGLSPSSYLVMGSSGLTPASDLSIEIGGRAAVLLAAEDTSLEVELTNALAEGVYDLVVHARGRDFRASGALIVGDVDAGLALDAGPRDAMADASGTLDADGNTAGDAAVSGDAGADAGDAVEPDGGGSPDSGLTDAPTTDPDGPVSPLLVLHCTADSNVLGCWPFDGDATDASGNGNDLMATAVGYPAGGGIALDALSDVHTDRDLRSTDLSMVAWVRVDSLPRGTEHSAILHRAFQYELAVYPDGELRCYVARFGGTWVIAPGVIGTRRWQHVACVVELGATVLYVDGVEVARDAVTSRFLATAWPSLWVGRTAGTMSGGADSLMGRVDELAIYDAILTPTVVRADFDAGRP